MTDRTPLRRDWQAEQKLTSFHQSSVNSIQQMALASQASLSLVITIGLSMTKSPELEAGQGWLILFVSVLVWLLAGALFTATFARSALRIRHTYLAEWRELFPASPPYRLESFLFDFAKRASPLVGMSVADT